MDEAELRDKVERVCVQKNILLKHLYNKPELDPDDIMKTLMEYKEMVAPYVCDVSEFLHEALAEGKRDPDGRTAGRQRP